MSTAQEIVVTYGVLIIAWGMILGIPLAAARQNTRTDLLHQFRIVFVKAVLGPGMDGIERKRLTRSDAPVGDGK